METDLKNEAPHTSEQCTAIVLASAGPRPAHAGGGGEAAVQDADAIDVVSRHSATRIANELAELTQEYPIRHGKRGNDHLVFIKMTDLNGVDTWMEVSEPRLENCLRATCYRHFCKGPPSSVVEQVIDHIRGRGLAHRAEPCARRVHAERGTVWIGLGPDSEAAVKVTGAGWSVDRNPPVLFRHADNSGNLPEPVKGGSIQLLRKYTPNVRDEDWAGLVGFILSTLAPSGGYPILVLQGAQGVGKSMLSEIVRGVIDPVIELDARCALPATAEDIYTIAGASHLLTFDNCSGMNLEISDALCRVATGAARQARRLYSQGAVNTLRARNPIVINGISAGVDREDLLSRSICIDLQSIPLERRRSEAAIRRDFQRDLPLILGALLDAVSMAIRDHEETQVVSYCRLVDAATFVTAAEPALGFPDGAIVSSWIQTQEIAQEDMHGADPVVAVLKRLFKNASKPTISRTAADWVQAALQFEEGTSVLPKDFPRTAAAFGSYLKRREGVLLRAGFKVTRNRNAAARTIDIEQLPYGGLDTQVRVRRPGQNGADHT